MAKFDGKFLRGVIGPVILKKSGDKQLVIAKKKRGTIKQSVATKKASHTFGMASRLSGQIRAALEEESVVAGDGSVHARLTSVLNQLMGQCRDPSTRKFSFREDSFHGLVGFNFNAARRLADKLPGQLSVNLSDGLLHVTFPDSTQPRNVKFVKGSSACELIFSVALFRLGAGLVARTVDRQSVMVEKETQDLNGMSFSFPVPNDCLCLLSVTMEYRNKSHPIINLKLNAGAIYYAQITPGVYDESRKFLWAENELYFDTSRE